MKQKILRKKIKSLTIKKRDSIDTNNPFHNLSANNKQNLINNEEINTIKNHKINILPTNVNYQKASYIYNKISSPKLEEKIKKKEYFSSEVFINQNLNNINSNPLTLTSSLISQNSIIKKNDKIYNNNFNHKSGNYLVDKRNNNYNYYESEYFQNNKQKFSQTTPITFKNSRKTSNDKKNKINQFFQERKNSILSNVNSKNLTFKKLLGNNDNDEFINKNMIKFKLNNSNDKYLYNNNILPISFNSKEQSISPKNSNKKEFSSTGKKKIHNKILNILNRDTKLYIKHLLMSSQNKKNKEKIEENKNKKLFIVSKTSTISKTISHKASISKIQDIYLSDNLNIHNNNFNGILPNTTKNSNKKKIIIEPKIFGSSNKNKKTKTIFNIDLEKKIINFEKIENEKKQLTKSLFLKDEKLIEKYEIKEEEKKILIKEGKYYKQLSNNLSNYIKEYYNNYKEYPKTKISFYLFGRLIGRGAFGKVNLGLHILSGRIVAIKSFNKSKLKDEKSKQKIYHEINLMKNLNHNSIVRILETIETSNYILIIMEHINGGDLLSFVKKRTKLNEKTSKIIFKQLIISLKYIHSKGIIHRDIKLDNILIDLNNNIKICDFGVGKNYQNNEKFMDQCGTPAYIAPEILNNEGYEGPPVDIWSSGVVLYAMLSGTVPFKANNINDLHNKIKSGFYNEINDISNDAKNLICKLLEVDPSKRIGINDILTHPWILSCDEDINFNNHLNHNFINGSNKNSFFTKAEYVLLSKENLDYRNCNKDDIIENFTMKNLFTLNDKENKNINTKSNILAPFSSSIIEENCNDKSACLCNDLEIENNVIKFSENVIVLNRQYELNNNGEIDHGILINHSSSKNKEKKEEEKNNNNYKIKFDNGKNIKSAPENKKFIQFSKQDSQKNISSLTNSSSFLIDENIIKCIEEMGYKKEYIQKSLSNNEFNYATATFFLLCNNINDLE